MAIKFRLSLKQKLWLGGFVLFSAAQFFLLHQVDIYLQSPSITAIEAASQQAGTTPDIKPVETISVPADAVTYALSADKQHVAYTTNQNELIVLGKDGSKSYPTVGHVIYIQWLGSSDSILYFVQGSYLDANILQLNDTKPLLINEWWGSQRKIENSFFSPYMELLYIELQNGANTEMYKYDAVNGIHQLPLPNLRITQVEYDEMSDVMKLTDSSGQVWRYQNSRLYRPDGTSIYQSAPPSTGTPSSSGSSSGSGSGAGAASNPPTNTKPVPGTGTGGSAGDSTNSVHAGGGSTNSIPGGTAVGGATPPAPPQTPPTNSPPASIPPQNSGNSVKPASPSGSSNGPIR